MLSRFINVKYNTLNPLTAYLNYPFRQAVKGFKVLLFNINKFTQHHPFVYPQLYSYDNPYVPLAIHIFAQFSMDHLAQPVFLSHIFFLC